MKFLKLFIPIILLVFVFDLLINLMLPNSIKKKIGTSRNYSLKSVEFHHLIAPNINVNEFWGERKYKVKTNELSMRIGKDKNLEVDRSKDYVGFIGDSFVFGSGINYDDHFISNLSNNFSNSLNLGYVSYSPSIYFKRLKHILENERLKFKTIFLFIDHSDIQDEGLFYREDLNGNIVRKWLSDSDVKAKNRKYKVKNYLKQNSFIFKLYENITAPTMSKNSEKCLSKFKNIDYKKYIDSERFGYSLNKNLKNQDWIKKGLIKTTSYLDKIKRLSEKYNFKLIIVYYPSAIEVIDNIELKNSSHYNFLAEWSLANKIQLINTNYDFIRKKNINDYLNNFIHCDVHWNKKGHEIISNNINKFIND